MIFERPLFLEGEHFRHNRKPGQWRYTTLRTTRIKIDFPSDETISFHDKNGIEWMRLAPTVCGKTQMTIREGYSWDGATIVPDFCQMLATLVHDALYQFRVTEHFPFSRRECDDAFLDLMKLDGFKLALIYWQGVRRFGRFFKGANGEWSKILTTRSVL